MSRDGLDLFLRMVNHGCMYYYIPFWFISVDMDVRGRQPRVECFQMAPDDVAALEALESRGFLPDWDGDVVVSKGGGGRRRV